MPFPLDLNKALEPFTLDKSGYQLFAVIEHRGRSVKSGHYICYAKQPSTSLWYLCDDHRVREVSEASVLASQAFIVAYTRTSKLRDEDVRSNISISSFGTNTKPQQSYAKKSAFNAEEF